jgi:hypothetical protein
MLAAAKDFDLYGPNDWFGVTLTYDNDTDSKQNEPGAAMPADRIKALEEAHNLGIQTWVSMEPVLDPDQTLNLIEITHEFVDNFRVGKLNHFPEIEAKIDWPKFRNDVEALMQKCCKDPCSDETGKGYKLKEHVLLEEVLQGDVGREPTRCMNNSEPDLGPYLDQVLQNVGADPLPEVVKP